MACCSDEQLLLVARALSDPIRYQILHLISRVDREGSAGCCSTGMMCVCDIQEALGMKQSKVSYHLKELKNAGLLREQKKGKWHYYAVNHEVLRRFCLELNRRFSLNILDMETAVR
jgi:ArsR family transcriptional regulator, arsenate/arsenite/antimonite-responsive transcriptional repressor